MTVESYLINLASEMIIRGDKKESISNSFSTLESRLKSYFGSANIDVKRFGSYTRGTILPRKYDEKSDIDIMVIFKNDDNYYPQTFLNKLKRFAEAKYSTSEIYQSSPTIVLELNHIKFELVPAWKVYSWSTDYFNIPQNSTTWMTTQPKSFDDSLTECNKNNHNVIKPVVRLLKHWNIENNYRDAPSFSLEEKIASNMRWSYLTCSTYSEYLKEGLETIREYSTDYRINLAINKINKALELEDDGYPYTAIEKIKEVFSEK